MPQSQLMMSAIVQIRKADGRFMNARALLDTCSTANFITASFARKLSLPIQTCGLSVSGMNDIKTKTQGTVEIMMKSRINDYQRNLHCLVIAEINNRVPSLVFPRHSIEIPKNLPLADPQFHMPRAVDILISSGTTVSLLSVGQIRLARDNCDLCVQKTQLGWVTVGGVNDNQERTVTCNFVELERQLTMFWEVNDCTGETMRSQEDLQCEEHYVQHTKREKNGRYMVRLPFKVRDVNLGNTKHKTYRQFLSLLRRLNANPPLAIEYANIFQDYLNLNHMSRIEKEQSGGYFLPHHPVFKPSSTTTKVRAVFNPSVESDEGITCNQMLLKGPTIQPKLFVHLLYIRIPQYVVMADVEQMYRQILIDPCDRKFQQIFWKINDTIEIFELNTVTFGFASSPYLAIRTLHQLADDERHRFPRASIAIKENFYVDDFFYGSDSVEEVCQMRNDIIELLRCGGFNIRKWVSNHKHALDNLEQKDLDCAAPNDPDGSHKALGISWNSQSDELIYSVKPIANPNKITKRVIVSEIAKIFDPLGLLGPVILALKILIQDCWKLKVGWDETVPQALYTTWQSLASQLPLIKRLSIPRHLIILKPVEIQLHGFCDASQSGYGACMYVRSKNHEGHVLVRLACSRSRVAPVKQLTIPRLELCGAVLLTRLFTEAREAFKIDIQRVVFWTDSEIVLHWLRKMPQTLKVFEGNRVAEIQRASASIDWCHVPGKMNLADALSRGQSPAEFLTNDI